MKSLCMLAGLRGFWREYREMFVLNVVVVLVMMGMGMIGPILPLFGRTFGVNTTMIGFLITSFGLARMVLDLPAGVLAHRYGRRPVLVGGPILLSLGSWLCATSSTYSQLLVWRFLQGVGSAFYTTAAMTVAADLSKPESRGRTMAFYQGSILLGAGMGPLLGGFVTERLGSLRAPFFVFAFLGLLAAIWVWRVLPETKAVEDSSREPDVPRGAGEGAHIIFSGSVISSSTFRSLLVNPSFFLAGMITFGVFFTRAGAQMELIPLIGSEELGLSPQQIGFSLTLASLANFAVLSAAGWLADVFGRKLVIAPANLISGVSLMVLSMSSNYAVFLVGIVLYGIASGLGGSIPAAYAADVASREIYGLAMGLLRMFGDVGFVTAPILLGKLSDLFGYDFAIRFNAVLVVSIAVAFAIWARETLARKSGSGRSTWY